jgi:hypothetical protein
MSKITPKNLSYDSTLPPFLARLQANNNSTSRDGRHEFSIARPKKERSKEDQAEDEPLYFNEETGESLTVAEWEAREKETEENDKDNGRGKVGGTEDGDKDTRKEGKESKEKLAAIGGSKKRKAGKVVAAGEDEDDVFKEAVAVVEKKSSTPKSEGKKAKKKAKKVKLSFGDDE